MDLKDVVSGVYANAAEAHAAFHAGHHDVSVNYLKSAMIQVAQYLDEKTTPAGDVTGLATSEKPADEQKETPAEDPGSSESPVKPAAQFLGENVGQVVQSEKPGQ